MGNYHSNKNIINKDVDEFLLEEIYEDNVLEIKDHKIHTIVDNMSYIIDKLLKNGKFERINLKTLLIIGTFEKYFYDSSKNAKENREIFASNFKEIIKDKKYLNKIPVKDFLSPLIKMFDDTIILKTRLDFFNYLYKL